MCGIVTSDVNGRVGMGVGRIGMWMWIVGECGAGLGSAWGLNVGVSVTMSVYADVDGQMIYIHIDIYNLFPRPAHVHC